MDEEQTNLTAWERKKIRELEQELEIKTELLAEFEEQFNQNKNSTDHNQKELEQESLMFKEIIENLEDISNSEISPAKTEYP